MSSPYPPNAPYPYQGTPATAPTDLAIAAQVLAIGLALVQAVATLLAFPAAAAIKDSTSDDVFDETEVLLYSLCNVALIPALIAAYVVSCLWLHKCRKNVDLQAPEYHQERDSVWVWLGWWVPVVSFWFPFQVVRDVRRASVQDRLAGGGGLGGWWFCFLVWTLCSRIAGNIVPEEPDTDVANAIEVLETINGVAVLIALVLWLRIIREITRAQTVLVARPPSIKPWS